MEENERAVTPMGELMKMALGFKPDADDEVVLEEFERLQMSIGKPCWELEYCPYGPLVEEFPLLGPTREQAIEHNDFLKRQLAAGAYDAERRMLFEREVAGFDASQFPERHDPASLEKHCSLFGHVCPVFLVWRPFIDPGWEWRNRAN